MWKKLIELLSKLEKNSQGDVILVIYAEWGQTRMLWTGENKILTLGKTGNVTTITEDDHDNVEWLLTYLMDNIHILEYAEVFLEHKDSEELGWVRGPFDLRSPEDNEVIGAYGIVKATPDPEDKFLSLLYVAPDKTWTTLAVFQPEAPKTVQTAITDFKHIVEKLLNQLHDYVEVPSTIPQPDLPTEEKTDGDGMSGEDGPKRKI
jgi:hypothetical protein